MKVIFQIEGGSPVQIECNQGDNLLSWRGGQMLPLMLPVPAMVPAASAV